jgi:hypothetical protein
MSASIEALRRAVAGDPELAARLATMREVDLVVRELESVAGGLGLALSEEEIRASFSQGGGSGAEPLDDETLDAISGAGSPWCMFTQGCYCFFTK